MSNFLITVFREEHRAGVIRVWRESGLLVPQNDPDRDIDLKVAFQPDLFFVGLTEGEVAATLMAGYDGHRGWINYLGVRPDLQKRGYGRMMVEHASKALRALGCPKINLQVRTSNLGVIAFYEKLGFRRDEVLAMGHRFTA